MDRLLSLRQSESDSTNILFPSPEFLKYESCQLKINQSYPDLHLIPRSNNDRRRAKTLRSYQDRFIPRRSSSDMEVAQFKISQNRGDLDDEELDDVFEVSNADKKCDKVITNRGIYWEKMQKLSDRRIKNNILNFSDHQLNKQRNSSGEKSLEDLKFLLPTNAYRPLPKKPEKVLDLPYFIEDMHLKLLDWSKDSYLLLGLDSAAFIVDSTISKNLQPIILEDNEAFYSSVLWIENGRQMALGTSSGDIQIWDAETLKLLCTLPCTTNIVNCLTWNQQSFVLSSGDCLNYITHFDCRSRRARIAKFKAFNSGDMVTNMEFSPDGRYLAAGAGSREFCIFEGVTPKCYFKQTTNLSYKYSVAWCPWKISSLAVGGSGDQNDGNIAVWNIHSQEKLSETVAESRVTTVLWNSVTKELVSGHDNPSAKVQVWKHSDLQPVGKLTGYSKPITSMALSPNHTRLVTLSADTKLSIWKFVNKKKQRAKSCGNLTSIHQIIR